MTARLLISLNLSFAWIYWGVWRDFLTFPFSLKSCKSLVPIPIHPGHRTLGLLKGTSLWTITWLLCLWRAAPLLLSSWPWKQLHPNMKLAVACSILFHWKQPQKTPLCGGVTTHIRDSVVQTGLVGVPALAMGCRVNDLAPFYLTFHICEWR
jgi:hypothetical protein